MNRWLRRANQRIPLANAAALLVAASLFGQILGFIRIQVINGNFNRPGHVTTDAYFAAFKIPDFFFYTIAAGALGVAFMPFLADKLLKGDRQAVWRLTSSLLNLLGLAMAAVGILLIVFAEPLLRLVVGHNLGPQQTHDAVLIMRLIAFNPLLFAISGILTSLQQTFGRFFFYALAPLLYNGCIIASVYIFKDSIGIVGLGIGALAGAILQLMLVMFGLVGMRFKYEPVIGLRYSDFRHILRNLPARSIDQGIDSINSVVETNRASVLGQGNITFYENAYALHLAPILLIGTTIATAAFPRLNERLAQGRKDLFRKEFLQVLRAMIWIAMPVIVITFFTRGYLARLIYKNVNQDIALVLQFLVGAIFFRILYAIISRWFYAQKDTKTPLFVSLFTIGLNIVLAFALAKPISANGYGIAGLAIAQSIVAAVEVFILLVIMVWRDPYLFNAQFWSGVIRTLSVTGFTIITTYIMVTGVVPLERADRGFITLGSKIFLIIFASLSVHIIFSSLFGLEEVQPVIRKLKKIALKPVAIEY